MKLFIWKEVERATRNYHPEGGVVIVANSEEEARQFFAQEREEIPRWMVEDEKYMKNWNESRPHIPSHQKPNAVYELANHLGPEQIWVFPNAGCC